jgi:glycogenin glucosyltransferase
MLSAGAMLFSNAAAYSNSPSQLVILGMHHSGTSLLANLTMMMGAYGGEKDELLLHPDNPLKYWERRDVVALDEARLASGLNQAVSERYDVPSWVAYGFDAEKAAGKVHESNEAKAIVNKLNEKRPWVTKDPRMSLVASEWMQLLDAPACIIVHREPLSVANSMMIYSHNVSLAEWVSVYENYYASTMRACNGVPTVVVQHDEIAKAPYQALQKMYNDLVALGVQGLSMPAESRVSALLKPSASKPPFYLASERAMVSSNAQAISKALSTGTTMKSASASWLSAPRRSNEAIATLLTTTNADYLRGALVLGSSIRSFDSERDMIILVTQAVPTEWRSALTVAGWRIVEVEELAEFWWGKSAECNNFDDDKAERWGHMATKLRLWQMTQYSRIMYLDADTILTGPVDETFKTVQGFAAEKPLHHSHFNAGVMLLTPSQATFDELLALGAQGHQSLFGNVIDCTEQGLLNTYYNDKDEGRKVTKLAIGRADVMANWDSTAAPFAVHWITHVCPKPWLVADKEVGVQAHCDPVVYTYWTRVWNRLTASAKDESSARSFGSREAARRKMRRLTGVSAGSSAVGARYESVADLALDVRNSIGRKLRQTVTGRRELRRRRRKWNRDDEYERGFSEGTWAWIAIIGTLALGLGAGALLHKLFIKPPDTVSKGMTVVQAKRMGFMALGEGNQQGVVSAVDDDDEEDDEDEEEAAAPPKKK